MAREIHEKISYYRYVRMLIFQYLLDSVLKGGGCIGTYITYNTKLKPNPIIR